MRYSVGPEESDKTSKEMVKLPQLFLIVCASVPAELIDVLVNLLQKGSRGSSSSSLQTGTVIESGYDSPGFAFKVVAVGTDQAGVSGIIVFGHSSPMFTVTGSLVPQISELSQTPLQNCMQVVTVNSKVPT